MPLFVRLINLDEQKQLHEIDASITFFELGKVVEEGSGEVVDTPCWRFMPCLGIPPEPLHDEYWLVFTVAGLSEGKVKLQPKVRYKLNGETAFTEIGLFTWLRYTQYVVCGVMKDYPKTLTEFEVRFSSEEACRDCLHPLHRSTEGTLSTGFSRMPWQRTP
jgi:hypothetical protein